MSRKYRQWVKEYQDQAWTVARYILKDEQEAEDATQEAFVKLWNNRDNIDPNKVKPWLMRVTRNGCLDRLRRRRDSVEFDESHMASEFNGPMQGASASEAGAWLKRAMTFTTPVKMLNPAGDGRMCGGQYPEVSLMKIFTM